MPYDERTYSVLLISNAQRFTDSLRDILKDPAYETVKTVSSISEGKRELAEKSYDLVIINSQHADGAATRLAIDTITHSQSVILLAVRQDIYEEIFCTVSPHGIFTLSLPTSRQTAERALRWLTTSRELRRKSEEKNESLQDKMQEIRTINRAKLLLITKLNYDESAAHRYIEKQAMDQCVTRLQIAKDIIEKYK